MSGVERWSRVILDHQLGDLGCLSSSNFTKQFKRQIESGGHTSSRPDLSGPNGAAARHNNGAKPLE